MEENIKVLIFKIGQEFYGADIMQVERILGYEEPTPMPETSKYILGVINQENTIIPVISLQEKFRTRGHISEKESKIIVVKDNNFKVGILVDSVSEVRDIKSSCIENPPAIISGASLKYLKGLIKLNNKIVLLLTLDSILTEDEKMELAV